MANSHQYSHWSVSTYNHKYRYSLYFIIYPWICDIFKSFLSFLFLSFTFILWLLATAADRFDKLLHFFLLNELRDYNNNVNKKPNRLGGFFCAQIKIETESETEIDDIWTHVLFFSSFMPLTSNWFGWNDQFLFKSRNSEYIFFGLVIRRRRSCFTRLRSCCHYRKRVHFGQCQFRPFTANNNLISNVGCTHGVIGKWTKWKAFSSRSHNCNEEKKRKSNNRNLQMTNRKMENLFIHRLSAAEYGIQHSTGVHP